MSDEVSVHALKLAALEHFFAEHVADFRGSLSVEPITGGRSNLTYRLTDGHNTWVLRRPPDGGITPSAHDVDREYRVIASLADTGVPVPHAVALGDSTVIGAPFAVFEHVSGTVVRTLEQLHALPTAEIIACAHGLIDVLARIHAVDTDTLDPERRAHAHGYVTRQVSRWQDQWRRVSTRALPDIETLHSKLAERSPAATTPSLVHGDYRIDNAILDTGNHARIRAIVDWEMATLGDPRADLGLHLAYRDPAFAPVLGGSAAATSPRLPSAAELAQRYSDVSGRDLSEIAYFVALGYFKAAVIAEGIHARSSRGSPSGAELESPGDATAPLAAAGLRAITSPI